MYKLTGVLLVVMLTSTTAFAQTAVPGLGGAGAGAAGTVSTVGVGATAAGGLAATGLGLGALGAGLRARSFGSVGICCRWTGQHDVDNVHNSITKSWVHRKLAGAHPRCLL